MSGKLRSKRINAGIADVIIDAPAATLNAPLLTNNDDHYSFVDLNVIWGLYK